MKRRFNKKAIILASAALALTGTLTVGSAMAYFTTYTQASGSATVHMGFTQTVPHEELKEKAKHVSIENTGDYDCYVRVKAFSVYELEYKDMENWKYHEDDGYLYYTPILHPGETTTVVEIGVEIPEDKEFDVVVVQECSPVFYDEEGNPTPNWDFKVPQE